jgi:hypothetical protein
MLTNRYFKRLREFIIEALTLVRMTCREIGHFINLTKKKSPDIKIYREREDVSGKQRTSGHFTVVGHLVNVTTVKL